MTVKQLREILNTVDGKFDDAMLTITAGEPPFSSVNSKCHVHTFSEIQLNMTVDRGTRMVAVVPICTMGVPVEIGDDFPHC